MMTTIIMIIAAEKLEIYVMMIMEAEVPCCRFVGHQCKSKADISILSLWNRESNCNLGVCNY